jgi:hypothetical protein
MKRPAERLAKQRREQENARLAKRIGTARPWVPTVSQAERDPAFQIKRAREEARREKTIASMRGSLRRPRPPPVPQHEVVSATSTDVGSGAPLSEAEAVRGRIVAENAARAQREAEGVLKAALEQESARVAAREAQRDEESRRCAQHAGDASVSPCPWDKGTRCERVH